jgi:hypothetical protein
MTTQSQSLRLAISLARTPWAWPGGYPRYGILDDSEALCHECAKEQQEAIATTTGTDGWCLKAIDINWEDTQLYCAHCSARIPAAYEP